MELFQQFLLRLGGQIAEDGLAALLVADDDAPLPACGPCRPRMVFALPCFLPPEFIFDLRYNY